MKIKYIIFLDTNIFISLFKNENNMLSIDVINTQQSYKAPIMISVFTLYELLKNKNQEQHKEILEQIDSHIDGFLHIKGVTDNHDKKNDPSYWLKKLPQEYDEFKKFVKSLESTIFKHITPFLTRLIIFDAFCSLLVRAVEKVDNLRYLYQLVRIIKIKEALTTIEDLIYQTINEDLFFLLTHNQQLEKLLLTIKAVVIGSTITEDSEISLNSNFYNPMDGSRINKLIKDMNKPTKPEHDSLKKIIDFHSLKGFVDSIFDILFQKENKKNLSYYLLRHVIINRLRENKKYDFNDWIDILNLNFIEEIDDAIVMYATKEKEWRKFIKDYSSIFPKLEYSMIIGDEGSLD